MPDNHLFVYGTLRPGDANEHILAKVGGSWREATITGRFVNEGWGFVNHGLPAFVPDVGGQKVPGLIFISDNIENHWAELDELEGADYERVLVDAECSDGEHLQVYVYALRS